MEFYQSAKWKVLVIILKPTATLSIIGSSLIIHDVLCKENRRKKLKATTNRIVTLMSILDVICSFVRDFLGAWMIPKEYGVWGAAGNQGTCRFQGFVGNFLEGATTGLNATLAITYILVVRYGWKEDRLQKPLVSFVLLGAPVLARFAYAVWPMIDRAFNWGGAPMCYISPAPLGCSDTGDPYPCKRGTQAPEIKLGSFIQVQVCFAIILTSTVTLYLTVLQKERATDRYVVDESQRSRKQSKRVAMQGIWYAGSFFLTWIFWWIYAILAFAKRPNPYWLTTMMAISIPLQGFWNAIVYFRPRFIKKKERNGRNSDSSLRQSSLARLGLFRSDSSLRQSSLARHTIGLFRSSRFSKKTASGATGSTNTTLAMGHKRVFNDNEEKLEEDEGPVPNEVP